MTFCNSFSSSYLPIKYFKENFYSGDNELPIAFFVDAKNFQFLYKFNNFLFDFFK
jgi:hypothetical protein